MKDCISVGIRNFNMNKQGLAGWLVLGFIFLVMALVAGLFGFGIIAGASWVIAKWMVLIFVFLFIISVIAHTIKKA